MSLSLSLSCRIYIRFVQSRTCHQPSHLIHILICARSISESDVALQVGLPFPLVRTRAARLRKSNRLANVLQCTYKYDMTRLNVGELKTWSVLRKYQRIASAGASPSRLKRREKRACRAVAAKGFRSHQLLTHFQASSMWVFTRMNVTQAK
jgi:hypothetical protein